MSEIWFSLKHEGTCSICEKKKAVISFGDKETEKVAHLCGECSDDLGKKGITSPSDFVNEHGVKDKEPFDIKNSIKSYSCKKESPEN